MIFLRALIISAGLMIPAVAADWSQPVEVRDDDRLCVTYRARWDGDLLAVEAKLEPGWHTFSMDNKQRQDAKLAGKQSLGAEKPTTVKVTGALESTGPWMQTEPKDFSKPELRWFTWGFDDEALFVAKSKRIGAGTAEVNVRGQACSDSVCKNVNVTIPVTAEGGGAKVDPAKLSSLAQ